MGREAIAVAHWRGEVAEVKALLESTEIILRGTIKARIPRSSISEISVSADELKVRCDGKPLVLELGETEARKWREVLVKPPPTLASKLGVGPEKLAFVIGNNKDSELATALKGARSTSPKTATAFVAILRSEADLKAAYSKASKYPELFLWCVYAKGKNAIPSDSTVRSFMRGNGYTDNKSCAVSADLTATRYGKKR